MFKINFCTGNEIPGSIRVYGVNGCIQDLLSFTSGGEFTQSTEIGSLEMKGARHTALGTNMYVPWIYFTVVAQVRQNVQILQVGQNV